MRCVRTPLAKGAVLWTYDEEVGPAELTPGAGAKSKDTATVTIERFAIVVEGDHSVLALTSSLQSTHHLGGSLAYLSLDNAAAFSTAQLGQLAQDAATAWQGSSPDVPVAGNDATIPSSAPQATLGPPRASAFAVLPAPVAPASAPHAPG